MSGGCAFQIDSYEKLYEEVSKCENIKVFSGWLQCDCRPFKQGLLNTIKRWSFMFKRHLSNHVLSRWAPPPPNLGPRTRTPGAGPPASDLPGRASWCGVPASGGRRGRPVLEARAAPKRHPAEGVSWLQGN